MSRDEVIANIGTIAKSGTQELLATLREREAKGPELIGQFGVGFYSCFLVASKVILVTRRADEETATRWESDGTGSYLVSETTRPEPGTTVILELKPVDTDEGIHDYTDRWVLESIVRKYSDFVSYPIKMMVDAPKPASGDDAKLVGQREDKTLNSMKAIWTRPTTEVSEAEYNEFYKHVAHDWKEPFGRISTSIEGTFEARALLFLPEHPPFDLYRHDVKQRGVQLYVKRIFIMDDCENLLPTYLRFVRGVVDCEDLPLNVSREMLQENRQIRAIRKHLIKKVIDHLTTIQRDNGERYLQWWNSFGAVLKEGLLDGAEKNDKIFNLLLAPSTRDDTQRVSLDEYIENADDEQKFIYYVSASSLEKARRSPHLEAFADEEIEVLFFTDHVDEIWLKGHPEYRGKTFKSITEGELEIPQRNANKDKKDGDINSNISELLLAIRTTLQDKIKDVRTSSRLRSSPACLVTEAGDLSPQMERLLRATGQDVPRTKRVLEVNPTHVLIERMAAMLAANGSNPTVGDYAHLLLGQATLAEGGELDDPTAFAHLLTDLMVKSTPE